MLLFHNDYNEICHPEVLRFIMENSTQQMDGYGEDAACTRAADLIRSMCGGGNLAVHFLVGGTQTNLTVIDAALRPHQAVLCATSAHVNVHETGAVEATGHKILTLPSADGKISACQIRDTTRAHLTDVCREHTVQPKLVYISNPTELGTIYTRDELVDISSVCREFGLYLFLDGARLGYGLTALGNDLTLKDIAAYTDVFYIGGTKVGAMFGEAVVISNPALQEDFRYLIKQHGAMLAKGWLLGLQFEALFRDGLYFNIASHANRMADKLRQTLDSLGYSFYVPGVTNQVFSILPNELLEKLKDKYTFSEQECIDPRHRAVRFCTSWATKQSDVDALCRELERLSV